MDSAEVGKYIESVAVRIGFHDGGSLAGTGVLYTLQTQNRAVVLTAGHVLQRALAKSHSCPAVLSVWSESGAKAGRKIFFWSWLIQATIKQLIFTIVRVL